MTTARPTPDPTRAALEALVDVASAMLASTEPSHDLDWDALSDAIDAARAALAQPTPPATGTVERCGWCGGSGRITSGSAVCPTCHGTGNTAPTPAPSPSAALVERGKVTLDMHQGDSYGQCVVCRVYVPNTDDEFLSEPFPCPTVRLAALALPTPPEEERCGFEGCPRRDGPSGAYPHLAHSPGTGHDPIPTCHPFAPPATGTVEPAPVGRWSFEPLTGDGWAILDNHDTEQLDPDDDGTWSAGDVYGNAVARTREDAVRIVNALNTAPTPAPSPSAALVEADDALRTFLTLSALLVSVIDSGEVLSDHDRATIRAARGKARAARRSLAAARAEGLDVGALREAMVSLGWSGGRVMWVESDAVALAAAYRTAIAARARRTGEGS